MRKNIFIVLMAVILHSCHNNSDKSQKIYMTKPVENITPTKDQQERRNKSEAYCKLHNIPIFTNPNALFVEAEDNVTIRTKDEIADRALALCYIGLKGEGLDQNQLENMDKKYHIAIKLSVYENNYVRTNQPTEQQKIDASWRYESLHVMLWALGFIDTLDYPDYKCDIAHDVKIIQDLTEQQFKEKAKVRSKKEILDQADLILRIDWACVNAGIKNEDAPGMLDKDVVYERHYSLNWLINYMNQDWDHVTTDT